jgi:hypothetical protein
MRGVTFDGRSGAMRYAAIVLTAMGLGGVCASSVGCDGHTSPVEPSPVCSIVATPASQHFTDDGGTGPGAVATAAGCTWTATSAANWLLVTAGRSGVGAGSVVYTVAPNGAPESRTATLSIESQRHTVTQSGRAPLPCTFAIEPRGIDVGKDAVDGTFSVSTAAGCAWTAASTASWLTVTGGASGTGPGTVSYAVARNTNYTARDGGIMVGDTTFAVRQSGDAGVPRGLNGVWNGRLIDYPGGRTFQMTLAMNGDRVTGRITGDGTGGGGIVSGVYTGSGPVHLEADFGDGKQYFDGAFDGIDRIRGTSTYNQRPPVYQFDMSR